MDKIKTVKIKNLDGSISEETYTISVDAKNVDMENGKDVQEIIGDVDIDNDGNVGNQLKKINQEINDLNNNKINKIDIVDNLTTDDSNKVLSAKQGKILNDKIEDKCEFIFPGRWGVNGSGNSAILKIQDKVLLFDANSTTVWSYLNQMLVDENVNHIDYVIISHFDSDHRGNLQNLIDNNYIDSRTTYIHPYVSEEFYTQTAIDWYNNFEQQCSELGIESIIPEDNQTIEIMNNLSLRFGNLNLEYAKEHYTNPNQACMVVEIKHNNFYYLIMGDALEAAQTYLVKTNFIKNEIQFYGIPHHAIEHSCNVQFYDSIHPQIAVAQNQMKDFNWTIFNYNQDSAILFEKGCSNYYGFNNPTNIKFIEKNGTISCIKGVTTSHSGYSTEVHNIYCDSVNYNPSIQNGTEEYPYIDLIQALGMVPDYSNQPITIWLKDGEYGKAYLGTKALRNNLCTVANRKNYIYIRSMNANPDDCIINNGLFISNCYKVRIEGVTIKPSLSDICLSSQNSAVYVRGCKLIGNDQNSLSGIGIKAEHQSIIKALNNEFQYLSSAYWVMSVSEIVTNNDLINNVTRVCGHENGVKINIGKYNLNTDFSTIGSLDNYSNDKTIYSKPEKYTLSIPTPIMLGDISIPFGINNIYKNIVIYYNCQVGGTDAGRSSQIIPFASTSSYYMNDMNCRDNGDILWYNVLLAITNNKITIMRNRTIKRAADGTITSYTPSSADDVNYGLKITSIDFV